MVVSNFFSTVPHVIDDGSVEGECYACKNNVGNRAVLVDATGIAGIDNSIFSTFRYQVCAHCGTLDLIPSRDDATDLYGDNYYSFEERQPIFPERFALNLRNRFELTGNGLVGRALSHIWPGPHHRALRPLLAGRIGKPLLKSARILDVGCGSGKWLKELYGQGFTQLFGVDPFLESDTVDGPVKLFGTDVQDIDGHYDLVTIHHAFEHIADGEAALSAMRSKLTADGVIVVRIPLGASYGWKAFGGHWVQLDPPRHAHLYSVEGMKSLADRVGLETRDVIFDATSFMVAGSEASLVGMRPHKGQPISSIATQRVFGWARARRIAQLSNHFGTGDQAAFYLTPRP